MNAQSLRQEIARKLDRLADTELQTVAELLDFLAWRSAHRSTMDCPAEANSGLSDSGANTAQVESINGILVLRPAIEPVDSQILATALKDARMERTRQLMSW